MKRNGYTLTELLVVMALIIILSAFMTPVISRAKVASQISSSLTRLHELQIAVSLYRTDAGEAVQYGDFYQMGLPPSSYLYKSYLGLGRDFWVSPCGYKDTIERNNMGLSYEYAPSPLDASSAYMSKYRENSVLFEDPHCNAGDVIWGSYYMEKRGLGVTVDGRLLNIHKRGFPGYLTWWTSPPAQ